MTLLSFVPWVAKGETTRLLFVNYFRNIANRRFFYGFIAQFMISLYIMYNVFVKRIFVIFYALPWGFLFYVGLAQATRKVLDLPIFKIMYRMI